MAEVREINTIHDLTEEAGKMVIGLVSDGMIRCSHYCLDERNKWNTHIITVEGVGVIGFTNGPIKHL
jgi:hypothetical protein